MLSTKNVRDKGYWKGRKYIKGIFIVEDLEERESHNKDTARTFFIVAVASARKYVFCYWYRVAPRNRCGNKGV